MLLVWRFTRDPESAPGVLADARGGQAYMSKPTNLVEATL
jgi:hypothetical protein